MIPGKPFLLVLSALAVLMSAASGQVRISEFQANTSDDLVARDANGVFQLGGGVQWQSPDFDASSWATGTAPLGYDRTNTFPITTDLEAEIYNKLTSVYLRWEFDVTPELAASADAVALRVNYNDGFIAFLNGRELGRGYMGGEGLFVYHDQKAFGRVLVNQNQPGLERADLRPGTAQEFLRPGRNVLAIQLHNAPIDSLAMFVSPTLRAGSTRLVTTSSEARYFPGKIQPSGAQFG